jgi:N-acetylneuraminate synthase
MVKLIAEGGINHNGDIDICKKMIDICAFSGFNYFKLQKRNPDKCVPEDQKCKPKSTPWGNMTYLEYKHRIEFDRDQYGELNNYCHEKGIGFFASVWDLDSAEFMREFSDIVKIPSALITDYELLTYCRRYYSLVLMSTGMSTEEEIDLAVKTGQPDVIMHTVSEYPALPDTLSLEYIAWLKEKYPKVLVGYSGHEYGLTTTFLALCYGVDWIERHVTLDHEMWGTDQSSSIDPVGMIKLCRGVRVCEKALSGFGPRKPTPGEIEKARTLRK